MEAACRVVWRRVGSCQGGAAKPGELRSEAFDPNRGNVRHTAVTTVGSLGLVFVAPRSFDAWSFFVQLALLSVGAGLLLRSMYPPAKEEAPLLG